MRFPSVRPGVLEVSIVAVVVGIASTLASASDPSYVAEFPDPRAVIAPIEGSDRLDTLARQAAALGIVSGLIKEMAGARYYADANYPSPDEQRVLDSFSAASTAVHAEARSLYDPRGEDAFEPRRAWEKKRYDYASDPAFRDRLLERHFSPEFLETRLATIGALQERVRQQQATQPTGADEETGRTNWSRMNIEDRIGAVAAGLSVLVFLVLGWLRERRPTGFVGDDFTSYRVGFRRYRVDWVTGTLKNFDTETELRATESEQYDPNTHRVEKKTSSISVTLKETFDLEWEETPGDTHIRSFVYKKSGPSRLALGDGSFAPCMTHRLTFVRFRRRLGKEDNYVASRDWTDRRDIDHVGHDVCRGELLASRKWTLLPAGLMGLFGWSWVGGWGGFVAALLVWGAWIFLLVRWTAKRRRKFAEEELPRLWRYLETRVGIPGA